jgi:hypothetical protein
MGRGEAWAAWATAPAIAGVPVTEMHHIAVPGVTNNFCQIMQIRRAVSRLTPRPGLC